jgi:hypothetical protein
MTTDPVLAGLELAHPGSEEIVREAYRAGRHEAEMDSLVKVSALTLCLKDLLRPNETLAAAVERAQLLLDAHEAQE